ncbi:MAG: CGNR zinc finger domain-containing protein [Pyrinomonadaceae bacterium]
MTSDQAQFYIIGNNLALDFINSATHELNAGGLAIWAAAVGLIEREKGISLMDEWRNADLVELSSFRDRLREVVVELVGSKKLKNVDIKWINEILREKGGYSELVKTPDGFAKQSKIDLKEVPEVRVPIVEAFVDLVALGNIDYIRKCERTDCILYFYDTTKNHRRRWCSMSVCGNRAKVAKFYEKQRSKTPGE